jgi:hypothetical protein
VTNSYHLAAWQPFFVGVITAGAALAGLVFVAVSINLKAILQGPKFLPARAAETLATLMLVVVSCSLALVPQNSRLLGIEIFVIAAPMLAVTTRSQLAHRRGQPDDPALWHIARAGATAGVTVPACLAGASLAARWGGGAYWLVPTVVLGVTGAMYSAWVLLVEILR